MSPPGFPVTFFPVALATADEQKVASLSTIVKEAIPAQVQTLFSPPFLLTADGDRWTSKDDVTLINGNVILLDPLPAKPTLRQIQNLAAIFKESSFVYLVSVLTPENNAEAIKRKVNELNARRVTKFEGAEVESDLKLEFAQKYRLRNLIQEARNAPPRAEDFGLKIKAVAITLLIMLTIAVVFIGSAVLFAKMKRPLAIA